MKRTLIIIIIIIAGLIALPLLLQDRTLGEGELILVNEAGISLDRTRVETAAQSLVGERAVDIAIYIVSSGTQADFHQRLIREGLVNTASQVKPRTFTIYIGVNNRYSEIGWGSTLSVVNGEQIRREILNPRLQEGDYTGSLVNALNIATERFDNPYSFITSSFSDIFALAEANTVSVVIIGAFIFFWLGRKIGLFPVNSGNSYSGDNDYDHHIHHDSSSDSIDFGGSDDSGGFDDGGGFDGGSWDD